MIVPARFAAVRPGSSSLAAIAVAGTLLALSAPPLGAQLREVGRARLSGRDNIAYSVAVQGTHAFVTGNRGVHVFDVSDPARPRRVALLAIAGGAFDAAPRSGYVFVASAERGLLVADVRDPARVRSVAAVPDGGGADGVAECGGIAYLSDGRGWLRAVDVRDPERPRLLSRSRVGTGGHRIACGHGLVYYADPRAGLHVVDVSEPTAPRRLATVAGTGSAWDPFVVGERLYLGRHGAGVSVLDLGDPRTPRVLGTVQDGGEAYGVTGDGSFVYVADLQQGIELFDASTPASPRLVSRLQRYAPHDIDLAGRHVYLADQDNGFIVFEADAPPAGAGTATTPADEWASLLRAYAALPRYPRMREVYRHRQPPLVSRGEAHPPYLVDIFEAPGTLTDVLAFYGRELPARGWRVTESTSTRLRATQAASGFTLVIDPSDLFPDRFLVRPPAGTARWGVSVRGRGFAAR